MKKKDKKRVKLQQELVEAVIPFDKLPPEIKASTFEYIEFRRELSKESDRGCSLLAAAHLDDLLKQLLKKRLIGNKKHFELLFAVTGPLGSFSSRTLLSYSIGLISSHTFHDIQKIRKIRNEFGHTKSIITFESQKIKDLCDELKLTIADKASTARDKFLNSVSGISGQLEAFISLSKTIKEKNNPDLEKRKKVYERMMTLINSELKKG